MFGFVKVWSVVKSDAPQCVRQKTTPFEGQLPGHILGEGMGR